MVELIGTALAFTALVGLMFAPLEWLAPIHPSRLPAGLAAFVRARRADIGFATFGLVLTRLLLVGVVGTTLAALDELGPGRSVVHVQDPALRTALEVTLGLGIFELVGYAYHRLAHAVPVLFRLHAVHHSSESLDWLAAFRQHPLEIVATTLAQNAPLVLLGIPLGSHALVVLLLRLNTVFVHSNVRVPEGAWDLVFATPRFHHRHHARLERGETSKNFATLFPLIDRLFGTYEAGKATTFGLIEPMPTTFRGLLVYPFRTSAASRDATTPR